MSAVTPPVPALSFDHALGEDTQATRLTTSALFTAGNQATRLASSVPFTPSRHATPQRDHLGYPSQLTASSGYESDEESRPGPPPLPPRNTRPDYVERDVFTADPSDTTSVSDVSSIADTENNTQDEIEDDYYWRSVDEIDFQDEGLAALLASLAVSTSNVVQTPAPVAGPSTLSLNLADPNVTLPFQSTGPFYVVTKGSVTGVFDDWLVLPPRLLFGQNNVVFDRGYVHHITRMKGSAQKGYKTLREARFRYQRAVTMGIVEVL